MRNLLLVILISASSVWASDSYSQNTQLKLSATEGTIESIFNQISKQSRLEFFYNTNILNAKEKVSLSIKQGTLDEILKEILGERYSYTIKDRYILITKNKTESAEQNEMIRNTGCDMIQGYYHYRPMELSQMYHLVSQTGSGKQGKEASACRS